MVTFLFVLGIAIMGGVIYMAISRKSTFQVRIAALGALALMIVSVIIGIVVFFKAEATPKQLILPDMMPSDMPPPTSNTDPVTMIMLIVFLIVLFVVTFLLSLKGQKRTEGKEEPPSDDW